MNVIYVLPILFGIAYFYWGRGLIKSKTDDLKLGLAVFVFSVFFTFKSIQPCWSFHVCSGYLLVFSLLTFLLIKRYKKPEKSIFTKIRIKQYAGLVMFFGVLFALIL